MLVGTLCFQPDRFNRISHAIYFSSRIACLKGFQTVKAEQSLQSLKKLSGPEAKVLRNGTVTPIPARELVVGDVILLEAGDYVPADGRLIENASLKIDEKRTDRGESCS